MPNQNNFRSDITTRPDPRFIASRIVSFPEEDILTEILPASFGYDILDNIEIHFYSLPSNVLFLSTIIDATDAQILKSHVVSYNDGTFKNYIRIDFTKLFEDKSIFLSPGEYKIVINFFADEIGNYANRKLYIQNISDSKTEVQVGFYDTNDIEEVQKNLSEVRDLIEPSFSKATAIGVAEKIFRSGVSSTAPDRDFAGLTFNNIKNNIETGNLQTEVNTLGRLRKFGGEYNFIQQIEEVLPKIYRKIREEIVIRGDRRIQEDEFREFIEDVVEKEIANLKNQIDSRIDLT
jgi:hypothetical protein